MTAWQEHSLPVTSLAAIPLNGIRWPVVFAGLAVGLGVNLLLMLFGVAAGFAVYGAGGRMDGSSLSIAAGVWNTVSMIVAALVGGYVAARASGMRRNIDGVIHGVVAWGASMLFFAMLTIGRLTLPNRLVMAPMTRSRSDDDGIPSDLVTVYYAQRASAGLIITEGVFPSVIGKGYVRTPGIETDAQLAAWKKVTEAVHANGGRIFMQLMHCGRISHPSLLPNDAQPVAPSAIKSAGQTWTASGLQDFVTPRELSLDEIAGVIDDYRLATRRALAAGFDGVELHSASGYLPEQCLSSGSNQRQDQYGGSVANRARFVLEVLGAMVAEAGGDRVGIKISPEMGFNDIVDDHPQETYTYLLEQLRDLKLAYLHVALFGASIDYHALLRPGFNGAYLIGGGLDQTGAEAVLADDRADAMVFGGAFLANPDLPERFRQGAPLNTPDKNTFYSPGAQGYTDYALLGATSDN